MRNSFFRILYLASVFLMLINDCYCQSLVNYSSARNTGVAYASINVSGNAFNSWRNTTSYTQDDNRSDFTDIGFDFWYDGVRYTRFCVSTNGFMDFSSSNANGGPVANAYGYDNTAFTSAGYYTGTAIAPFYDDLTAQGGVNPLGTSIKYSLSGSAPNRTLTVEWINMAVYLNVTPSLNFQVKIVETTGQVLINYGVMNTGTQIFSYSMGLNGPTISGIPTAAQLKELQTVNTNNFSNTVQNNLSAMPAANSQYVFTPPVPTAAAGALTFSGVGQSSITLNWTNWAVNEVGYVIYNSTDGVNYNFVSQTAVNAVNANVTGLLPGTTYYWKLYAVTEGCLSAALSGTQATSPAGSRVSIISGNWSSAATWTPNGVPGAGDDVTIANGNSVTIDVNSQCNNLIVGGGSAATLQFGAGIAKTLTINNNITINTLANFSVAAISNVTHSLIAKGNITNNSVLNFATNALSLCNIVFNKNGSQTVSGSGATTKFNLISVDMGSSVNNILDISSTNFSAPVNFLTLNNGTFKLSAVNAVTAVPFTAATTISQFTGLWVNSSNAVVSTSAGITLLGKITVSNGTLNIGNAANQDLLSSGGTYISTGGITNVAGKYYATGINNLCYFNISGGTFNVPVFGSTSTTDAPFQIAGAGSQFNMTGGLIVIPREGGTGAQHFGFINTGGTSGTVTNGTLQIGNATTPAGQTISINSSASVGNLLVSSTNATAKLNTNPLNVINNITISSGTIQSNNLDLTLGGNWANNGGIFTAGTAIVNFSSSAVQSIFKSGGETFNHLNFSGGGAKTFSAPVITSGNFSISAGSNADVSSSNYLLTVKGNFVNSGAFNARNGQVFLNGTTAQTVGGSAVTSFFDLALTNAAGAIVTNPENLIGTLTLNGGIFNSNGMLTMVSTATATARIAQITGTGDITGNVIVQRFAPGGTTGWANIATPITSPLTFASWNDDFAISCPTCPNGFPGGFYSIYSYSESVPGSYSAAASYVPINNITDPIVPGKGYWVYLGDGQYTTNNIVIDVTGTVRKFNYSIPLSYTNYGSAPDDGWNLIHNPYPSPVSWAALKGATANIDNAIYVYNTDLNGGSGATATYINGVSSPAVGSGGVGDVIPMCQAFYVHSTGATALNATEANKVSGNPTFLKTNAQQSPSSLLRLFLDGSNNFHDESVLYLQPGATNGFDVAYDAYKMAGQDPYAPFVNLVNGGIDFQVNGVPPIAGTFTMNVKTLTGYPGTYTVTANNIASFPKGACITLFDKFTQTTTDLKTSNYIFNLSDTTTIARFVLNITINPLNISSNVNQPSCQFTNNGQIIASGANAGPWNYYWTLNGNAVKTSLNKNSQDSLSGLTGGNYNVEVNTVGLCDNNSSSFLIDQKIAPTAGFVCADSLNLNTSVSMPFYNASSNSVSYFWNFGDNLGTSNDISPVYNYLSAGFYTVNLTSTSSTGCLDAINKVVKITGSPAGIQANSKNGEGLIVKTIGDNEFVLEEQFGGVTTLNFKLYSASGSMVYDFGNINSELVQLNVNLKTAPPGIYFMKILSANNIRVVKLPVR
jgi:hypothetical protein